jgi:hypothetical protein
MASGSLTVLPSKSCFQGAAALLASRIHIPERSLPPTVRAKPGWRHDWPQSRGQMAAAPGENGWPPWKQQLLAYSHE